MLRCYFKNVIASNIIGKNLSFTSLNNNNLVSKSDLSKLRKVSGFSFSKCKEALLKFNNNVEEAHKWLKAEAVKHGWTKMGKLAERAMSNGLIGMQTRNISQELLCGVMVEVNCETDFVARNQNFHKLLHQATSAIMQHFSELHEINTISLNTEELKRIIYIDNESDKNETLDQLLAVNVGSLGENMVLNRAIAIKANQNSFLSMYSHLSWQDINKRWKETCFGKYGVILKYRPIDGCEPSEMWKKNASVISRELCQHIVGLDPVKIGNENEDKPKDNADNENVLIYQQFLLDENVKIKDLLKENRLVVDDFIRFYCGETCAI